MFLRQLSHAQWLEQLEQKKILLALQKRVGDLTINESEVNPHATASRRVLGADTLKIERSISASQTNRPDSTLGKGCAPPGQGLIEMDNMSLELRPSWTKSILWREDWSLELLCASLQFRYVYKALHLGAQDKKKNWFEEEARSESEISIRIRPAEWLSFVGIKSGLILDFTRSCVRDWTYSLSPIHAVPDDAPIFELCRAGNLLAVQRLLSTGQASVKDTCPQGFQPLHVSLNLGKTGPD